MSTLYKRERYGSFFGTPVYRDVPIPADQVPDPKKDLFGYMKMKESQPKTWCSRCQRLFVVSELTDGYCGTCSYQKKAASESSELKKQVEEFAQLKSKVIAFVGMCIDKGVPVMPDGPDKEDWEIIKEWPSTNDRCFFCSGKWVTTPLFAKTEPEDYCGACNELRNILNFNMNEKVMEREIYTGSELNICRPLAKNFLLIALVMMFRVVCHYLDKIKNQRSTTYDEEVDFFLESQSWRDKLGKQACCQNCNQNYQMEKAPYHKSVWYAFCGKCFIIFAERRNAQIAKEQEELEKATEGTTKLDGVATRQKSSEGNEEEEGCCSHWRDDDM